jgi:hypothetical protein
LEIREVFEVLEVLQVFRQRGDANAKRGGTSV